MKFNWRDSVCKSSSWSKSSRKRSSQCNAWNIRPFGPDGSSADLWGKKEGFIYCMFLKCRLSYRGAKCLGASVGLLIPCDKKLLGQWEEQGTGSMDTTDMAVFKKSCYWATRLFPVKIVSSSHGTSYSGLCLLLISVGHIHYIYLSNICWHHIHYIPLQYVWQ